MKKIQFCLILTLMTLLTGCATKAIMPALKYHKPINFHVPKNASLNWKFGGQYSSTLMNHEINSLVGALAYIALDSAKQSNHPGPNALSYGKAEQAIFMTSLRDILVRNHAFKHVELIADSKHTPLNDVLINVFFKTTRVASSERQYKITLSVEMTITTNVQAPFKRTYLIQSNLERFNKNFMEQQTEASNRLLEKIIQGIEEWHTLNNMRSKQ